MPGEELIQARIERLTETVRQSEASFAGFARAVLRSVGGFRSDDDVREVMADAYIAAAQRLKSDRELNVENMGGWFRRVLFLACLTHNRHRLRDMRRFVNSLNEDDDLLGLLASTPAQFDLGVALKEALGKLREEDRTIVMMSAEGYTSGDIADMLGASFNATNVRKRNSRALAALQKLLGGVRPWVK